MNFEEQEQFWIGITKDVAHQLGTPISALMGWAELLADMSDPKRALEEMQRNLARLKSITDRLNQIGTGGKFEIVSLREIIAAAIDHFQHSFSTISIKRRVTGSPTVLANRELLVWALECLIKNSLDALTEKKGNILIKGKLKNEIVIIDIIDNGQGILRENLHKVFVPGFSTRARGQGIGLSLARFIVEKHHRGKLTLEESHPGEKTVVRITLNSASSD